MKKYIHIVNKYIKKCKCKNIYVYTYSKQVKGMVC